MSDLTVWQRFSEVVSQSPQKIAISSDSVSITYQELYERAASLSCSINHALNKSSATSRIAFLIEDRISAVTSILSVLHLGHAFIPLDPEDPLDRLKLILNDSTPSLLLTTNDELNKAESISASVKILNLDKLNFKYKELLIINRKSPFNFT